MSISAFQNRDKSNLLSWALVIGLAVGFLLWGLFVFYTVGVKWPPPWSYGIVPDVPGESPYSTSSFKEYPGLVPHPTQGGGEVQRQHVMGRYPESKPIQ